MLFHTLIRVFEERTVPFAEVRLPAKPDAGYKCAEGDNVEVLSRGSDQEPYGWWQAQVKVLKGPFAVVDYMGWESTYTDIVALDRIRIKSEWYAPCQYYDNDIFMY